MNANERDDVESCSRPLAETEKNMRYIAKEL